MFSFQHRLPTRLAIPTPLHLWRRGRALRQSRLGLPSLLGCYASAETVVVVESPAKAAKIQQYLGNDYQVLASLGHVCDIPSKSGAVNVKKGFEVNWEMSETGQKRIEEIFEALKGASNLILATDPDREGEAISWHVAEQLKSLGSLQQIAIKRITFNQISEAAIMEALAHPRTIDQSLVDAYMARRVIDYLMGFSLSPVLWRKMRGARSAGRVQSPCLKLMCERETEILKFKSTDYWSVDALLETENHISFTASLTHLQNRRLQRFSLSTQEKAGKALLLAKQSNLVVESVEEKTIKERPQPPYRTSTLQQDAVRRLHWTSKKAMDVAQSLYEGRNNKGNGGLITYMRTDGVSISSNITSEIRAVIQQHWGGDYIPKKTRVHTSKVRNAQEAHEAIRPIQMHRTVRDLPKTLTSDERKLYELIWNRTIASQMSDAQYCQKTAVMTDVQKQTKWKSTARTTTFKGYTAVDQQTTTDEDETISEEMNGSSRYFSALEKLSKGLKVTSVEPSLHKHATKPPVRYNEASIVKSMEALGIGRPSTFATITAILQARRYVKKMKRTFFPQPLGRVLSVYLEHQFEPFVNYEFTASMESKLDDIASGKEEWKNVVEEFNTVLQSSIEEAMKVEVREIIDYVNAQILQSVFLPFVTEERSLNTLQKCPACKEGHLVIKFSKYGPFLGCDQYSVSKCNYGCNFNSLAKQEEEAKQEEAKITVKN